MTTKKKKKQTAKEDLIESLMNDVQELSNHETLLQPASSDLFSNNDYTSSEVPLASDYSGDAEVLEKERAEQIDDSDNGGATDLWHQIRQPSSSTKDLSNTTGEDAHALDENEVLDLEMPDTPMAHQELSFEASVEATIDPSLPSNHESADHDKTMNLNEAQLAGMMPPMPGVLVPSVSEKPAFIAKAETNLDSDKTVPVAGFANRQPLAPADVAPKVSFGSIRGPVSSSGSVYAASDATLAQSESLRLAQRRILELEKEVEKYRYENDELASAGDIIRERAESLSSRISALESQKQESVESLQTEIMILKGTAQYKETELAKARLKIEELEGRLKTDFKKIRVRERELENRLELVKAEKTALLRAKDENILDLKRKIDHLQSELDNYRVKVLELNKTIDVNQEQFKRTVRALRLALSNLEVKEESVVPFKKAD